MTENVNLKGFHLVPQDQGKEYHVYFGGRPMGLVLQTGSKRCAASLLKAYLANPKAKPAKGKSTRFWCKNTWDDAYAFELDDYIYVSYCTPCEAW